jgi:LacI family transcriptional regulator/LacI family asc operon transcriptional repressor
MQVPGDISIVGYNNSVVAVASEPELTSVDGRLEQLCTDTCEHLLQVLKGEKESVPAVDIVSAMLVKRCTTDF